MYSFSRHNYLELITFYFDILLSFYINKLGDGDIKDLIIASKRKYNKDPMVLDKLILENDNDLKKIRTYLSLNTMLAGFKL